MSPRQQAQFRADIFGAGAIPVMQEDATVRLAFLRKVYSLFLASIVATAAIAYGVVALNLAPVLARFWMYILIGYVAFLLFSIFALRYKSAYLSLGVIILFHGLLFGMIFEFLRYQQLAHLVPAAGILAGSIFVGLTAYVFITRKDFSFLGGFITVGVFLMFGIAIASGFIPFSHTTTLWYCAAGVLLFACFTLYDTSVIMRRYPVNAAAMAATALYLDFVILFWYILQILIELNRR